jgi:16S rRNA (uracil1498-N3)-methyltransferase
MRRYDFSAHRLFVDSELAPGTVVVCRVEQANYLRAVLRLGAGDQILIFNGRDGEWRARIGEARKSATTLTAEAQVRPQQGAPDIDYLFAPLKRARLDYMVQKATELGVARLRPIFTRRTTPDRINAARMRAKPWPRRSPTGSSGGASFFATRTVISPIRWPYSARSAAGPWRC